MRVFSVTPKIILFMFSAREDLTRTMLRFQEHYESANPEFRGRPFTLGEFRRWYADTYGAMTYYKDWSGFNFPSEAVLPFAAGLFDPLTREEGEVLALLSPKTPPYYVIATFAAHPDYLEIVRHEVCHGLYKTDNLYRRTVDEAISRHDVGHLLKSLAHSYGENVLLDELQAYLASGDGWFDKRGITVPSELSAEIIKAASEAFERNAVDLEALSRKVRAAF